MIKLISLFKRKPGLTVEEFEHHWRENHGPIIRNTKSGSYALRYEQHPMIRAAGWPEPPYDGCTIQWYESIESFTASISEPDYAVIDEDIKRFLDVDTLQWMLTEEPYIVIEGP